MPDAAVVCEWCARRLEVVQTVVGARSRSIGGGSSEAPEVLGDFFGHARLLGDVQRAQHGD